MTFLYRITNVQILPPKTGKYMCKSTDYAGRKSGKGSPEGKKETAPPKREAVYREKSLMLR